MYIKEIQTYGFKSFADKINFEFTKNINGIVGPLLWRKVVELSKRK